MTADAREQARLHLERATAILDRIDTLGTEAIPILGNVQLTHMLSAAHGHAATGHGWATLALTER